MPTPVGTGIPITTLAVIHPVTAAADSMVVLAIAAAAAIAVEEAVAVVVGINAIDECLHSHFTAKIELRLLRPMKQFFYLSFAAMTSCSTAIRSIGPNVDQLHDARKVFRRAAIIREFGEPRSTVHLRKPARSSTLLKGDFRVPGDRSGENPFVDSVDTYLLKGQIYDQSAMKDATVMSGLGLVTLGASEIISFPWATMNWTSSAADRHVLTVGFFQDQMRSYQILDEAPPPGR